MMRPTTKLSLLILLIAGFALAGCESLPIPLTFLQPSATLDPAALTGTMSAAETLTAMPTNTPTLKPTRTPTFTPTVTRTPVPTGTLAPVITIAGATNFPTLTKMPSLTPIPKPRATLAPVCDGGSYVADVTVPDGTTFTPGATFIKTWRIKNAGTCPWTTAYSIVFSSGDRFGAPASIPMPTAVAPGQTVDISISMTAPATVGSYKSNWLFKNASGATFGVGGASGYTTPIYAEIKVAGSAPSVGYDFTANACNAAWSSGTFPALSCPGTDGLSAGFVLKQNNPKTETGVASSQPGLIMFPEFINNGYIKGVYPAITIATGDVFKADLDCEYNNPGCNVTFTLSYISGGTTTVLLQKGELYDGKISSLSVDLGSLAGQSVQFVLEINANGSPTQDRAQLLHPVIVRLPAPPTATPTATPPPTMLLDFAAQMCTGTTWGGSAGALSCPGTDGDPNGYALAVSSVKLEDGVTYNAPAIILSPPNAPGGFIIGLYSLPVPIQTGDRFTTTIGCEFGNTACNVSYSLEYDDGSNVVSLWTSPQLHDGAIMPVSIVLTDMDPTLAGKTVTFRLILNTTAPSTQNRGVLIRPAIVR